MTVETANCANCGAKCFYERGGVSLCTECRQLPTPEAACWRENLRDERPEIIKRKKK